MKNKAIIFYLIFFVGGYLFFLTSGLWMPGGGAGTRQTPIGQATTWEGRQVTVTRWDYSAKEEKMEVELSVVNTLFDEIDKYEYSSRTKKGKKLTINPVIEDPDMVILQIDDVKEDFDVVLLQMMLPEGKGSPLKLYTGSDVVRRVDLLPELTKEEYTKKHMEEIIEGYRTEIEAIKSEIDINNKKIRPIEEEIERLKERQKYETDEDQAATADVIRQAESKIEDIKNTAADKEKDIKSLEEKIRLQEQKIKDYENKDKTELNDGGEG